MSLDSTTPTDRQRDAFRTDLLDWYDDNKRSMPWRETDDPYRIWVSEIMLQQTRVDTVRDYYPRFLEAFPTVEALAAADRDEVLKYWEGLGFYARARHLHEAAQTVVDEHDGTVPTTMDAIRDLKGIGPYTAAAVLSIAHDQPHAVLDGNVTRVLSRVFAVEDGVRLVVGDGEHRGGRVGADAFQIPDGVHRGGDGAVVLVDDRLGGLVQVTGPRVEAQSLPVFEHLVPIGRGQRLDGRKGLLEAGVVVADGIDAGLLENDFRHPDAVGIVGLAPGHRPLVCVVPVEQVGVKGLLLAVGGCGGVEGHGGGELVSS